MIRYIGYFDKQDSAIKRNYVTSAANKMGYIANAISESFPIEIISNSSVVEDKFRFYKAENKILSSGVSVHLPFSWGGNGNISRTLKLIWHTLYLFLFLLFKIRKDETIIVYHSLGYFSTILLAKKIKKFKLILEVEEIYSDVINNNGYYRKLENLMFEAADAYIFSTELLNQKINLSNKPYITIYGSYTINRTSTNKYEDNLIHIVYAGTFDPRKGCIEAIHSVEYLPSNYHLHVCGFGSDINVNRVKDEIAKTSSNTKATISYEGLLLGKDYTNLLLRCHIGLSPQDPNASFNATSFPSKILSYMSNGLNVVSVGIKSILVSPLAKSLYFYEGNSPKEIARAILSVDIKKDNRDVIEKLSDEFIVEIKNLIDELNNN